MLNLNGRFLPLSIAEVNNQPKVFRSLRICSFECTSEYSEGTTTSKPASRINILLLHNICNVCLPQVLTETFQVMGYFLRGGEDIYGKEPLFIGCEVTPLKEVNDVIPQLRASGLRIEGFIEAISSVFDLNTGTSVLLDVEGDSEANTKILLSGEAVHIRGFLSIGDKIEIINAKKFYWGSNTLRDSSPREHFSESYLVTSIASVVHHARGDLNDNENWITDAIAGIFPVGLDRQFSSKCLITRDILGHQEIDVEVEIIAINLFGWIRVSLRKESQQQLYLYVAHTYTAWVMHAFRYAVGATVRVCNVLPVFLWNKMRGFAFTGRSSISVLSLPKALVEVNSTKAKPSVAPTVPAEIRESCHMYTAFRADLTHRLTEGILNLPAMQHATKRLVQCIELMAGEYQQVQSPSSILEYKDMFVYYNDFPAVATQSPIRHLVSLRKSKHNKYSIQEEFSSPWHAAFYAVRGGCDVDYLCAQLPYVVSVKSISRNIEQKMRSTTAKCGLGLLRPFAAHAVDLFARNDGSHQLNLIVVGSLVKWESMHSSEGERFSALCVIRDADGAELHVIVTDCTQSTVLELRKLTASYLNTNTSGEGSFCIDRCQLMRGVQSPPVVMLHRPMCLFEENPSKLTNILDDVKLLVSATKIKLLSTQSCPTTADTLLDDKVDDARVAKKMKVSDPPEAFSIAVTSSAAMKCSVRDILQRYVDKSRGSVAVTDTVTGLVIYKEATLRVGLREQRCALTLRDEVFDDTLIIYIPLVSAALVTVGMHIEVKASRLILSKAKGSLYLEFARGIRIAKIADLTTMQRLCQRNQLSVSAATALTRCADHKMPPAISLARLYASYQGSASSVATCPDRVLWTLTGHVLFVREIHVRLRCKSCYTNLANRYCVCPKSCGGSTRFNPTIPNTALGKASRKPLSHDESLRICIVWEMTCVFDDGSGDCCVQFDGEDEARAYLRETHYPSAHIAVARIMDSINEKVRENGAFYFQIFDSGEKKKFSVLSKTSSALDVVDNMDDLDNQGHLSAALRASMFSQIADLVSREEVNLALALHLKCMRRSTLWQFSGRRSGVAERDGGGCHVKVQTANGAFPHQVRFCKIPAPDGKRIMLTGYNLKILERENLRLEAWKMLKALDV